MLIVDAVFPSVLVTAVGLDGVSVVAVAGFAAVVVRGHLSHFWHHVNKHTVIF